MFAVKHKATFKQVLNSSKRQTLTVGEKKVLFLSSCPCASKNKSTSLLKTQFSAVCIWQEKRDCV